VKIIECIKELIPYLYITFQYVLLSLIFGSIWGAILAALKLHKNKCFRAFANGYTTVMRCIPSIVLLFLSYYSLPPLLLNIFGIDIYDVPAIVFVIVTFTLFLGASLSEIIRSSYLAVGSGQFDAGVSIGLTPFQAVRRIIFPQAFYYSIPNLGNTVIYLLKEGALAFTIGVVDVMGQAYIMNSKSLGSHIPDTYIALAIIYWSLSFFVEYLFKRLERTGEQKCA
jgi:L-cystine transport system permease protein